MTRTGATKPLTACVFVDTLDLAEGKMLSLFSEKNSARVQRQRDARINVIIGNPPYNVGQLNENDNNKNRKYLNVDKSQYAKPTQADSSARNKKQDFRSPTQSSFAGPVTVWKVAMESSASSATTASLTAYAFRWLPSSTY